MSGPTVTVQKLHELQIAMSNLDTIRDYWDDGEQQRGMPTDLKVSIFEGSALSGNKLFCEELKKTILINWEYLFRKTMERLEQDVKQAGRNIGLIIRDPKAST